MTTCSACRNTFTPSDTALSTVAAAMNLIQPALAIFFALFLASTAAIAQEPYKCKVNGSMVIQDSPCKVVGPPKAAPGVTASPPVAAAISEPTRSDTQARLDKEKAWLDERSKKREKDEAQDRVKNCEAEAYSIQTQIDQVASTPGTAYRPNLIGVATMQLDEERRQTQISGLSARAAAKRAECDQLRQTYDRKYQK